MINCKHTDLMVCMALGHAPEPIGLDPVQRDKDLDIFNARIRGHQERGLQRARRAVRRIRTLLEKLESKA